MNVTLWNNMSPRERASWLYSEPAPIGYYLKTQPGVMFVEVRSRAGSKTSEDKDPA